MPYATAQDMVEQFGEREVIALSDREGVGVSDDAIIDRALADADAEIDSYLAGRYTLPLAGAYPTLKRHACNMARYYLSGSDVTEVEAVRARYKDAIRFLESIRDGKTRLAADGYGKAAPEATRIGAVGGERVFTDETLSDFMS